MNVKYAKECGFSVRKGTTKTNSKGVLHIKYYLCTRSGLYKDKKVDTLDPNQKERLVRSNFSKRTDCGALLGVTFEDGSWKVYKFVEEHNHYLVERPDKHFLPTEQHLTQLQKHVIHGMSKLNVGPVKAFNVMKTCFGSFEDVGVSKVEFKNYKRQINLFIGEYDADMVVRHLNEKQHILRLISRMIASQTKRIILYGVCTGIDNHHCNVTFGAALLASETADTYIWLLRVFLKAVGSQPKFVVTDQDPSMKKAISIVGVRLCNSTNFKERICGVVWMDILTPEEFESEWEAVIAEFNLADNDWLSDIFALRESWITSYYRMEEMSGLIRPTSRSESNVPEFPKQYILNRWHKEASPNCSPQFSISREYMTELDPDVQKELSLYKDHVQSYMKKVQDMQIVAPPASTTDRFAEITGQYKNDKNPIRVPVGYKSKGSGSRKRLKSKQEIAIEKKKSKSKPGAKERQCQNCKA
ncbi:protein FAR1-RELATED SEQUENCE 5-like [Helianthus annuus]|uniref:protein FAR1-RELATED SEQUENCE 5-like n=1 Tax=Helianthus annuus TaxID=4232 RepID=UPI000B8FDD53|nr:protein FAR1-RELATED SEQUENCE 5-like [Helianthus annuus]